MSIEYISVNEYCTHLHIETSFLYELRNAGLLEITVRETSELIDLHQLPELEQYIRWHYELDINTEGIETIRHLLNRVKEQQQEINALKNRLRLYE